MISSKLLKKSYKKIRQSDVKEKEQAKIVDVNKRV